MANYQLDFEGGEHRMQPAQVPDEALARRIARRDVNRDLRSDGKTGRVGKVRHTPNEPFAAERIHQPTSDFGVPRATYSHSELDPFSNATWRRLGHYEEIPNTDFKSAQGNVDRRRVAELKENPSLGVNPRLPDEKPYVLRVDAWHEPKPGVKRKENSNVIINGNHRVMSGIARNEMFSPALVVEQTMENEDAARHHKEALQNLGHSARATELLRKAPDSMTPLARQRSEEFVAEARHDYRSAGRYGR